MTRQLPGMKARPATLAPHGTHARAPICSDKCAKCGPLRRAKRVQQRERARQLATGNRGVVADTCMRGHERTPENFYLDSSGERICRVCRRLRERADYAEKRAQR